MRLQLVVGLDLGQHLAAVLLRQVQVQQDQVRARRVGVLALAPQERDRLDAVLATLQLVA